MAWSLTRFAMDGWAAEREGCSGRAWWSTPWHWWNQPSWSERRGVLDLTPSSRAWLSGREKKKPAEAGFSIWCPKEDSPTCRGPGTPGRSCPSSPHAKPQGFAFRPPNKNGQLSLTVVCLVPERGLGHTSLRSRDPAAPCMARLSRPHAMPQGMAFRARKEKTRRSGFFNLVPERGLEPPHRCRRQDLNLVRLPIPPSGRWCERTL